MNVEANKALVRRFYDEVWRRGNVRLAEEVFVDDYVRHDLRPTQAAPGGAGQALIAEQFRLAFPDVEWHVDLVLADSDLVAARWTASGTHTGAWGDVAPTGKARDLLGREHLSLRRQREGRRDLESPRRPRARGAARSTGVRRSLNHA
jgi:predicted ester cyclase